MSREGEARGTAIVKRTNEHEELRSLMVKAMNYGYAMLVWGVYMVPYTANGPLGAAANCKAK